MSEKSAAALAIEIGERLKQARLNSNLTQSAIAKQVGLNRKTIINAEKGKATLEVFISIMSALDLTDHLERFLPKQEISPIQLSKLHGKTRQRASGDLPQDIKQDSSW